MPPYGRGGAGNIQAIEQENGRIATDLAANQPPADSHQTESRPADTLLRDEQQYTRIGRGGLGNLHPTQEMGETSNRPSTGSIRSKETQASNLRTHGRGGAGNYAFSEDGSHTETARKQAQEHQSREKMKQDVENNVNEHLAFPQKAKLAGGEQPD